MIHERIIVIARHAQSTLNEQGRVNGDPAVEVLLTELGVGEARLLGLQLENLPLDACIHTRFGRTRQTAELALQGRDIPFIEEPLLDDIDVGALDGEPLETYRAFKRAHARDEAFPGGESLDNAARRYADAYERILARRERSVLVICHEIPLRYALNGARESDRLDGPVSQLGNAQPFFFTEEALGRAVSRIRRLTGKPATLDTSAREA